MTEATDLAAIDGVSDEAIANCPQPCIDMLRAITGHFTGLIEKKDERIEELEEENESVKERVDGLENDSRIHGIRLDGLSTKADNLCDSVFGGKDAFDDSSPESIDPKETNLRQQVDDLEEKVEKGDFNASKPGSEAGDDGSTLRDLLPIDRIALSDDVDDCTIGNVTESVERAAAIYENFRQWSDKTTAGRVIHTSGGKRGASLKTLLETATGESLEWKQVTRACRKIEEWSKGTIQYKETERHGKMLIGPDDIRVGYGQSSSPANHEGASVATA